MLVKTRMTATPFTVTSATKIPEALEVMTSNGVRHLHEVEVALLETNGRISVIEKRRG